MLKPITRETVKKHNLLDYDSSFFTSIRQYHRKQIFLFQSGLIPPETQFRKGMHHSYISAEPSVFQISDSSHILTDDLSIPSGAYFLPENNHIDHPAGRKNLHLLSIDGRKAKILSQQPAG